MDWGSVISTGLNVVGDLFKSGTFDKKNKNSNSSVSGGSQEVILPPDVQAQFDYHATLKAKLGNDWIDIFWRAILGFSGSANDNKDAIWQFLYDHKGVKKSGVGARQGSVPSPTNYYTDNEIANILGVPSIPSKNSITTLPTSFTSLKTGSGKFNWKILIVPVVLIAGIFFWKKNKR